MQIRFKLHLRWFTVLHKPIEFIAILDIVRIAFFAPPPTPTPFSLSSLYTPSFLFSYSPPLSLSS